MALAMLVVTSDLTIAAIALPGIADEFGITPATSAWVLLIYALPMAAVAIPAGRWADRSDLRSVFTLSMVVVGITGIVAAVAPSFFVLSVARLVQGFASALIPAVYMPIIAGSVRGDQRGRAIGYVVTVMTIGGLVGAPLGGLIAGTVGWPGVFILKLPLVLAAAVVGLLAVPGNGRRLAVPDLTLARDVIVMGGAVASLLLGIDRVESSPVAATGLILVAVVLGVVWVNLATSRSIVSVVAGRVLGLNLLGLFLSSLLIGLISFLLPYFVATEMDAGPEVLGVALLVFSGAMAPVSPVGGWLADRYGAHLIAMIGAGVSLSGVVTMLTLSAQPGLIDLAWRLAVIGVGAGLFNGPINATLLAATPPDMIGVAGGMFATVRTMAGTIGPALTALVWTLAGGGAGGFTAGIVLLTGCHLACLLLMAAGRPSKALEPVPA